MSRDAKGKVQIIHLLKLHVSNNTLIVKVYYSCVASTQDTRKHSCLCHEVLHKACISPFCLC